MDANQNSREIILHVQAPPSFLIDKVKKRDEQLRDGYMTMGRHVTMGLYTCQ